MGGLVRLLLLALILWLVFSALRRLFLLSSRQQRKGETREGVPLVQDLQCGRFVSEREAVTTSFRGQRLHFCSQECCTLYIRSQIAAAQEKRSCQS